MTHRLVLLLALTAAPPAIAQEKAQDNAAPIVVTGTPLSATQKRLADCIARNCPPNEDISASLAHAENQLLAGDYNGSRGTLAASHGRNGRYAKQFPVEVSDLDRAYGRLTDMTGFPDRSRIIQIGSLDTLKEGFESGDARILVQRIMVADEFVKVGRLPAARDLYRKVEKEARAKGEIVVAGMVMQREASLYTALASVDPGYAGLASAKIARLERAREPELASLKVSAAILRARLSGTKDRGKAIDEAIDKIADKSPASSPVLVYAEPPFETPPATGVARREPSDQPEWIDVSFRIDAKGRVSDVQQLRNSPRISTSWTKDVLASVSTRRYLPLALKPGTDGIDRVERFTYAFDIADSTTGTHLANRGSAGRLTSLDITAEP